MIPVPHHFERTPRGRRPQSAREGSAFDREAERAALAKPRGGRDPRSAAPPLSLSDRHVRATIPRSISPRSLIKQRKAARAILSERRTWESCRSVCERAAQRAQRTDDAFGLDPFEDAVIGLPRAARSIFIRAHAASSAARTSKGESRSPGNRDDAFRTLRSTFIFTQGRCVRYCFRRKSGKGADHIRDARDGL